KPNIRPQQKRSADQHTETASRCLSCGTSLRSIFESAEVGCANCYATYGKEVESILEAVHSSLVHRGKSFTCDDSRIRVSMELQSKRLLLRSMLKSEKYEEAARLRDEIAALELRTRNISTSPSEEG
ncbi:MAG: UvrB/UvrC motif-containing protein, partial [Candidatus Hydrogenedentes bacterium]|nr:UvrB/UvrC motif-containing protein [Candidatus Hydrogenedentota bacterium]